MFFDPKRWEYAINKGVDKDIRRDQLIKLTSPETRLAMYEAMKSGKYVISPPHTAKIPKDNGEFRTVYINEPMDRVMLSITNDLLFDLVPEMIHPACKSYQRGIGCGKVVVECSEYVAKQKTQVIGFKSDLSKYFDSVPIEYIDKAFDDVEAKYGKSKLIDVLRNYYHNDYFFDENGKLCQSYQSLKQGCAVASWLANVILYHIDDKMSKIPDSFYSRYSDDTLFISSDPEKGMKVLETELNKMGMKLNPKKVEYLKCDEWFKFLGFAMCGEKRSLGKSRIKTFQKEIEKRTIKNRKQSLKKAVNAVNRYLYKGNGEFSWATAVLPIVNVEEDINEMNKFILDCLKAVETGKCKIGGLGFDKKGKKHCIVRGKGRNVASNRKKVATIEGYLTIKCMQNAILTRRAVYNTLVASL